MPLKSYRSSSVESNVVKKVLSNADRVFYATGGNQTTFGEYIIHTFRGDGSFIVDHGSAFIEYLIVAGGGGGGMDMGGGGGAGGVITGTRIVTKGTYTITVGAAGVGAPAAGTNGQPGGHQYSIAATNGGNSSAFGLTAIGGGAGGSSYYDYSPGATGGNGGSGGGASGYSNGGTRSGGTGTSGQGFNGGRGGGQYYSGGGGGASSQGTDSTSQPNGGDGITNAILGISYYWGGGGGGASYSLSVGGNGGRGGGGGGALGTTLGGSGLNNGYPGGGGSPNSQTNKPGGNAGSNTGGGGGGGSHYNSNNKGGNGGSGIVVIRYKSKNHIFRDPYTYEILSYTLSGNLTLTGGGTDSVSIFKTSGSNSWDNHAYSTSGFTAPCTIEFNKLAGAGDNGVSYAMIGWNEDPTANASYTTLDYASYPYDTNGYYIYHNGSGINPGVTWNSSLKLYVVYTTDGYIKHYNGSTLLYTSPLYGTGKTVYVDSSFYSPNATYGGFSNIRVVRKAWNGTAYI